MSELTAPGWGPTYTGDRSLGDVGSGARLGAHLYYLYRAGRNELPSVARTYALLAIRAHEIAAETKNLFDLPGQGIPLGHRRVRELHEEAQHVLRLTAVRLQRAAHALVDTAARYAAVDDAAAAEFTRLLQVNADQYRTPPPAVPPPPVAGGKPAPVPRPGLSGARPR